MKFITTTVMLTIMLMVAWLVGCTDVPTTAPDPIEVNSEFRFLNAAGDLNSVDLVFDLGPNVSGLAFQSTTDHATYPSGARVGAASNGDTLRIAMTTDQRATVLILPLTNPFREILKLIERRIFDDATTSTARIRVVHVAADGANAGGDLDVTITGADTSITVSGLSFKGNSGYFNVPAGSYQLDAFAAGDTNVVFTTTITAATSRYTSVITGDLGGGAAAFVNMADN